MAIVCHSAPFYNPSDARTSMEKDEMISGHRLCLATIAAAMATISASSIEIETGLIAEPDNPPDTNGRGSVSVLFRIGLFEVMNDEYVVFLNAMAADDLHGLYDPLMTESDRGGILREGAPGMYTYSVKPNFSNKPVNSMSWLDAARFCNWLHNDQPSGAQEPGTTETGAYDMSQPDGLIERDAGATWFLPTDDEWYKAAYYDPFDPGADGSGTVDYWRYPTRADQVPEQVIATKIGDVENPGPNVANYGQGADWGGENGNVTSVGGTTSSSPWGMHDMAGNVNEWTETLDVPIPAMPPDQPDPLPTRTILGGDFASPGVLMSSPFAPGLNMVAEAANIGFRVAQRVTPGDIDGDGAVGFADLLLVLGAWGPCPRGTCPADVDGDGAVGFGDLLVLLTNWT